MKSAYSAVKLEMDCFFLYIMNLKKQQIETNKTKTLLFSLLCFHGLLLNTFFSMLSFKIGLFGSCFAI